MLEAGETEAGAGERACAGAAVGVGEGVGVGVDEGAGMGVAVGVGVGVGVDIGVGSELDAGAGAVAVVRAGVVPCVPTVGAMRTAASSWTNDSAWVREGAAAVVTAVLGAGGVARYVASSVGSLRQTRTLFERGTKATGRLADAGAMTATPVAGADAGAAVGD